MAFIKSPASQLICRSPLPSRRYCWPRTCLCMFVLNRDAYLHQSTFLADCGSQPQYRARVMQHLDSLSSYQEVTGSHGANTIRGDILFILQHHDRARHVWCKGLHTNLVLLLDLGQPAEMLTHGQQLDAGSAWHVKELDSCPVVSLPSIR